MYASEPSEMVLILGWPSTEPSAVVQTVLARLLLAPERAQQANFVDSYKQA